MAYIVWIYMRWRQNSAIRSDNDRRERANWAALSIDILLFFESTGKEINTSNYNTYSYVFLAW